MRILVAGGGGFIGGHLVRRLLNDGHQVVAVDIKWWDQWWQIHHDAENVAGVDLRHSRLAGEASGMDAVVNLAANMGGLGFITYQHAACMESALINLNLLRSCVEHDVRTYLFASSACIYPEERQTSTVAAWLRETDAYPACPDTDYGWEKLFSERAALAFAADHGLNVKLPRLHNCYGPHGTWTGGREKAPAAICRKVAEAVRKDGVVEVWGDGDQTRSFMYVDDCVEGIVRLLHSNVGEPVNLGSAETVSINDLVETVAAVAGVEVTVEHVPGPQGVRGRSSDNTMIRDRLGWEPATPLQLGIAATYPWVADQVARQVAA